MSTVTQTQNTLAVEPLSILLFSYDQKDFAFFEKLADGIREISLDVVESALLSEAELNQYDVLVVRLDPNDIRQQGFISMILQQTCPVPAVALLDRGDAETEAGLHEIGFQDCLSKDTLTPTLFVRTMHYVMRITQMDKGLQEQKKLLMERLRELDCLYMISRVAQDTTLSLDEILQGIVEMLPVGWQNPEMVYAHLAYENHDYKTSNYNPTPWKYMVPVPVDDDRSGFLEIGYLDDGSGASFLDGGNSLLMTAATKIGEVINRKHNEAELRDSQAKLNLVMSQMPTILWSADQQLVLTSVAGASAQILGREGSKYIGRHIQDIFPDETLSATLVALHSRALAGEGVQQDILIQEKSFDIRVHPLRDERGQIIGCVGNAIEITERKAAEQELHNRTEEINQLYQANQQLTNTLDLNTICDNLYQIIQQSMPCDSLILSDYDPGDRIIHCLYARHEGVLMQAEHLPNIPLEPRGKGIQSTVVRTGKAQRISNYQELLQKTNSVYEMDARGNLNKGMVSSDITTRSALVVPIKLGSVVNGIAQVLSYQDDAFTDDNLRFFEALLSQVAVAIQNAQLYQRALNEIHHRQVIERKLLESERFSRAIFNSLSSHIAVLDSDGTILDTNRAWRDFGSQHGVTIDPDCIGKNYLEARRWEFGSNPNTALKAQSLILSVIEGKKEETNLDYAFDNSLDPLWFKMRVTRFAGDGPVRVVVSQSDISELKQTEILLQQMSDHLLLLNRVMTLVSSTLDTDKILEFTCRELANQFNTPSAIAILLGETQIEGLVVAQYQVEPHDTIVGKNIPLKGNPTQERLILSQEPIVISDLATYPEKEQVFPLVSNPDTASLMFLPLIANKKTIGTILLETLSLREFTETEVDFASSVALAISQSLETSLLHQQVANQNRVLTNLVERRTTQLNRINERMSAILSSTSDAIVLLKSNGIIENTNPAFDQLFLCEPDEFFNRHISELVEPPQDETLREFFNRVVLHGERQRLEFTFQRKDGRSIDIDAALAPIDEVSGKDGLHIVVCSMRDITHIKEVERLKDRFISTVSHELRTPLTGLMLGASSLRQFYERASDAQRMELINRIYDQAGLLSTLIEDILQLSQLEAKKKQMSFTAIDMREVAEQTLRELEHRASNTELKIQFDSVPESVAVVGSALDFSRIWRNLIDNAIKYTPSGGNVFVRLGTLTKTAQDVACWGIDQEKLPALPEMAEGNYMIGQIEDTGMGIAADDLAQLFTRFFRGSAAHSNIPGTGLGLSLIRELLAFYGGDIGVTSEFGQGSVFSFWLPISNIEDQS